MIFQNQVAIVTGAASGIGRAISKKLLAEGATIAALDLNADALAENFGIYQEKVKQLPVDITDSAQVDKAVSEVIEAFGQVDLLVNSAGITGITNIKSHEVSTENLRKVFEVNFFGSYNTSKAVLPHMIKKRYGRILHIASIAGKEGNAGMLAYSSSKAAVIGMTKVQGKEYAETGITVNALAPAVIRTALVDAMPEAQVQYMTDKIPMKRCGTLDEIAEMAAFIVSPFNSFSTGAVFDLSGGRATY